MKLLNALPGAVSQGVIWGIMAIGVYITYRILDVADLTVDGSIATGGAVAAVLIISGCNAWVALVAAFVVGMLTGLVTGVFHTWMGIPAILSGILTQLALYSINLGIMSNKANTAVNANKYDLLVSLRNVRNFSLDNPILLLLIITAAVIALLYWFFGTEYGCALRATGANVNMARAQGINTGRAKVVGLMLSNGLVALSGALLTQYQGYADVSMGRGAIVIGLAAVIIGEVLFGKIFRNFATKLIAVSIGAIIYYIVMQVVLWLGLPTNYLKLLTALVVAMFLAVPHWRASFLPPAALERGRSRMLDINHIAKTFNPGLITEKRALADVDLHLAEGDFVTMIGGNGAGKSTTLNAVAGTFMVDRGSIVIDGVDVTHLPEYKRAKYLGRVFQDPMNGTAATMNIEENLALAYRRGQGRTLRWGITAKERDEYREKLATLGLGLEDRMSSKVGLLSGGQRQALTLLMATIKQPKLLLLDEHTAALDPKTAKNVLTLTQKIIAENHLTAMMVTHNMKDALEYGNRTIMMHEGKIILDIDAETKKRIHVEDLLVMFEKASGSEINNDRMLLG